MQCMPSTLSPIPDVQHHVLYRLIDSRSSGSAIYTSRPRRRTMRPEVQGHRYSTRNTHAPTRHIPPISKTLPIANLHFSETRIPPRISLQSSIYALAPPPASNVAQGDVGKVVSRTAPAAAQADIGRDAGEVPVPAVSERLDRAAVARLSLVGRKHAKVSAPSSQTCARRPRRTQTRELGASWVAAAASGARDTTAY